MTKLLVVNPNSSVSVTDNIKKLLAPLGDNLRYSDVRVEYFTGPPGGPDEITGDETSEESARLCFPLLKSEISKHDAILVCCYSKHPLIELLNKEASDQKLAHKLIIGIFNASLVYAVSQFPKPYLILTSNESWEDILNRSVHEFFGNVDLPFFKGTYSSKVNVLGLQDPKNFEKIIKRIQHLLDKHPEVKVILLGCAGFSGLEDKFASYFPHIQFVDSVKIGFKLACAFD